MISCPAPGTCDRTCGNWHPYDPCPCGTPLCVSTVQSSSLSYKAGHVVKCRCRVCTGRRSKRKGQAGQAKVHKSLGGEGPTPTHEESARAYTVLVRPEVKSGGQVPATLMKLLDLDFTRRAFVQARRSASIGSGVKPAVTFNIPGGGSYMIVELEEKR